MQPAAARWALAGWSAFALFCIGITLSPLKSDHRYHKMPGREFDLALYRAEARRMHAGEDYYSAIATELRARGYPTRSVFNWRMPLPVWLFGVLPYEAAEVILCAAAVGVLYAGTKLLAREAGTLSLVIGLPLLFGAVSACFIAELSILTELWSGVFIALSLCAYGNGRNWVGVFAGLAAQFLRELAAIYSLIALAAAVYRRRWLEAAVWTVGLGCYALYVDHHIHVVSGLIRPDDVAQPGSWIRFGGAPFVIGTAHLNSLLLLQPQWIAAVYLAVAMLGIAGWNSPLGMRLGLTMSAYLVAFSIVGHSYNQYWGALYAPLLALGAARAPAALRDLWRAAQLQPAAQRAARG